MKKYIFLILIFSMKGYADKWERFIPREGTPLSIEKKLDKNQDTMEKNFEIICKLIEQLRLEIEEGQIGPHTK